MCQIFKLVNYRLFQKFIFVLPKIQGYNTSLKKNRFSLCILYRHTAANCYSENLFFLIIHCIRSLFASNCAQAQEKQNMVSILMSLKKYNKVFNEQTEMTLRTGMRKNYRI